MSSIARCAVMGNPVQHSLSPKIHQRFAEQTGIDLSYDKIKAPLDAFSDAVSAFQAAGGMGLNITLPFKQQATSFVDVLTDRARLAGAVNTILFKADGTSLGDNTDGAGLVNDLKQNHSFEFRNKQVLVLGAGGAAYGIVGAILGEHPRRLQVANRHELRASALAKHFRTAGTIQTSSLSNLPDLKFDVVINATSASVSGDRPEISTAVFAEGCICYDLFYQETLTPFLSWAKQKGVSNVHDGFGMLVEQAAESFYLWHGIKPETQEVHRRTQPSLLKNRILRYDVYSQ